MDFDHKPVLFQETIEGLNLKAGGLYMDATVGGGGHARAILEGIQPGGVLIGIDQDQDALNAARERLQDFASSFKPIRSSFLHLKEIAEGLNVEAVDGILFDLGVSSYQLDNPDRGFTYWVDAPLDMRMDQRQETTAESLVNTLSERELSRIIRQYGEERWAGRIARFIVDYRVSAGDLRTTEQLVSIIKNAIPARARREGGHPARRTFQALRIAVNRELDVISPALHAAADLLAPGGRLAVITFHSLEDRIVKRTFVQLEGRCSCPPDLPYCVCKEAGPMEIITRKPISPAKKEVDINSRARSAKLRIAEKREVLKERSGE
jgi:16S rRNA (cytosine1402-N4)-methyltransferase